MKRLVETKAHPRQADPEWWPTERLYVRLAPPDPSHEVPFVDQMDLRGASCNREKYSQPSEVLVDYRPHESAMMCWSIDDLPGPFQSPGQSHPDARKSQPGVQYSFKPEHVPLIAVVEDTATGCRSEHDVYAHSEVRLHRPGVGFDAKHEPGSKPFRLQLREELARRLKSVAPHEPACE